MKKAFVIGYPLSHTLSPTIHGHWLEKYKIKGSYEAKQVRPEKLKEFVATLDDDVAGFNITLPFKQEMLALVDDVDETAKAIGAINTVVVNDGKLFGSNTDGLGFIHYYKMQKTRPLKGAVIAVLGAGGASRGVCYSLIKEGVSEIKLFNRDPAKAKILANDFGPVIQVCPWEERNNLSKVDLLVNTTSLGMKNQPDLDINLEKLEPSAIVYDIVYNPLETPLLQKARAQGLVTIDGLGMLIHQAAPGFKAWFGTMPEEDESLRQKLLKAFNK